MERDLNDSNILVGGLFLRPDLASGKEAAENAAPSAAWDAMDDYERSVVVARLDHARELLVSEAQDRGPSVLVAPEDPWASLALQDLAERKADDPAQVSVLEDRREAQFDHHDVIGWAKGIPLAWLKGKISRADWIAPSATATPLPDQARVVMLGDWASGMYGAPVMAHQIENDPGRIDLLVHLGDVYYAGTERAVRDRFLRCWPRRPDAISRACNGNHEMYPGGHAYFGLILPTFQQQASAFALQNAHWLIVGLDTAYEDGALAGDQVAWLTGLIEAHPNRQVILLSHHQPLTLYDKPAGKAVDALEALLTARRIQYWYWGHEHRCVIFDQKSEWGLWGRCIGHSGFPEFRLDDYHAAGAVLPTTRADQLWLPVPARNGAPRGYVLDGPNPYVPDSPDRYVPHGYASLELKGPELTELVHDADGTVLARIVRTPDGRSELVLP